MHVKPIHPFPARMAPSLALDHLSDLGQGSIVLDPMAGSGTVLRQALELGHHPIGFDVDPLAVLMCGVWTTPCKEQDVEQRLKRFLEAANGLNSAEINLPWIDSDPETIKFIEYWFASQQINDLRKIAYCLSNLTDDNAVFNNVLRLSLSKLIITKEKGASLARDVSHSRPHKVTASNDFDVFKNFERAALLIFKNLQSRPLQEAAEVRQGDARNMWKIAPASVDAVFTSPPYLNAIDYLRGHRLALVWLGYTIRELREIRSGSIGAERALQTTDSHDAVQAISDAMHCEKDMPPRITGMIKRYAEDVRKLTIEVSRVLKPSGIAVFVIGNSTLRGNFVSNANAIEKGATLAGLKLHAKSERELPSNSRYLPMSSGTSGQLAKRMRTECILSFTKH